jgi:hypothetical protein
LSSPDNSTDNSVLATTIGIGTVGKSKTKGAKKAPQQTTLFGLPARSAADKGRAKLKGKDTTEENSQELGQESLDQPIAESGVETQDTEIDGSAQETPIETQ